MEGEAVDLGMVFQKQSFASTLFYSITCIVFYHILHCYFVFQCFIGRFIQDCTPYLAFQVFYMGNCFSFCADLIFMVVFRNALITQIKNYMYMNASYHNPVMPHTQVWIYIDTRYDIPRSYVSVLL
jgi:hypothetical protein